MNQTDTYLVHLLGAALLGRQVSSPPAELDWGELYQQAVKQRIHPLIYSVISSLPMPAQLHDTWEKEALMCGFLQEMQAAQTALVMQEMGAQAVPCILMKGAVLRELYPQKEMRAMSDVDLLISEKNLEQAVHVLSHMGYQHKKIGETQTSFYMPNTLPVELHTALFEKENKFLNEAFSKIWNDAETLNGHLVFSKEDTFLYMIAHLAKHCMYKGFGLCSLCDVVLFLQKEGNALNWDKVNAELDRVGLSKFAAALIALCVRLFETELPWHGEGIVQEEAVTGLFENMMASGVHGVGANHFIHTARRSNASGGTRWQTIKACLFPTGDALHPPFSYGNKNPLLLPVAWLHRAVRGISTRQGGTKKLFIDVANANQEGRQAWKLADTLGISHIFQKAEDGDK